MTKVAILGSGVVGEALAKGFLEHNHAVHSHPCYDARHHDSV